MTAPIEVAYLSFDSNMFGSERSLLDLFKGMDGAVVRPHLVLVRPGPLATAARAEGVDLEVFRWLEGPFPAYNGRALVAAARLAAWLRSRSIRVVELNRLSFGHLAVMNMAARLAGCRTIVRVRMPGVPLGPFQKLLLLGTDRVISVSESSIAPWRRGWTPRGLEARLSVMPDSRDVEALKSLPRDERLVRALGVPAGAPLVGMVGAVIANKRQDLFLRAAELVLREVPDAWFMVVGGGLDDTYDDYAASLSRFLEGKPLAERVVYTGYRDDALPLMKNFDALVMPSDREAFGGVLIEAMALGVPVVAHRVDGMTELVADGATGLLIDRQDPAPYADAVVRLLREPALATRLRDAASAAVERFDSARLARGTEAVYAELCR